ncbi:MAG TPA: hypothetical protein VFN68_00965 [Acidimicrobiales bacterium]|nr:hypothetical protein [Acidimicrobiales bacterium]
MKILFRSPGPGSDPVEPVRISITGMADFLVVLFILAFVLAMMGLIWALDRV